MALSKPTNGSNADYANRIGLLFDAFNNGNYAFPSTQVPSADPNTLDDYEEGTWTPSLGGNTTYTTQVGRYTKIGRVVEIEMQIVVNAIGTGSTGAISGLPFANNASVRAGVSCGIFVGSATSYTFVAGYIELSASAITCVAIAAAGPNMGAAVLFGNSTNAVYSGKYTV